MLLRHIAKSIILPNKKKRMANKLNKVGVYGTLKKAFWNHRCMERAEGVFVREDYVQIKSLWSCGYPMAKFVHEWEENTNKWLKIEVYNVDDTWVTGALDSLEGYTPWSRYNLYDRIVVPSLSGEDISVYEICSNETNIIENYFVEEKDGKLLYNWK